MIKDFKFSSSLATLFLRALAVEVLRERLRRTIRTGGDDLIIVAESNKEHYNSKE
jgi:hypothetical protein